MQATIEQEMRKEAGYLCSRRLARERTCGKLHPSIIPSLVHTMPLPLEALESEILRLPAADRAKLLDHVVASLDGDSARDAAWDAVAARRDAEIEAGLAAEVSVDEVLARLRAETR